MNDTILNPRQTAILELLRKERSLSRNDIVTRLQEKTDRASITILRDLNDLIQKGYIRQHGRARATVYRPCEQNPLLEYINLDAYFAQPLDERNCKVTFDSQIFSHLHTLYQPEEKKQWDASAKLFSRQKASLTPTIYKRESERFLIDLAWKSSQIEGNTYDLIETETLLKEKIRARGHSEEEATMILNHKSAFEFIREHEQSFAQPLTSVLVFTLHEKLVSGMGGALGLRNQQVRITGTRYIPPSEKMKMHSLFERVISSINEAPYPPDKALIAASLIAYLQPFADGNKRTSRMLSNALLLAYGYHPLSYRNVDVTQYRKAIILVYEQTNLYHLKRISMEQLSFAIEHYFR
jgi:fido (protein-threonine AMPylation protein)/predicted transcriptional regulator